MVLIFSEQADYCTYQVIRWLKSFQVDYFRLNKEDDVSVKKIDLLNNTMLFEVNSKELDLSKINAVWYRRGFFNFDISGFEIDNESIRALKEEAVCLNLFLMEYLIENKFCINNQFSSFNNKISTLLKAKNVGLNVPETYLTSFSTELPESDLITKSIGAQLMINNLEAGEVKMFYTEKVDIKEQQFFFPSLFQTEIIKKFELRIFYLLGSFYSMAILSQNNLQTSVDFRKYDLKNPNRTIPYKLPISIERKLGSLMQSLKLNSGSIDMIFDVNGEYIFLEVNPVGQFGMVSLPCNYYLEKNIALKLSSNEKS
ncbi:grasp-with-spasm system ATP-grasp peptide maturase [Sphingobacterium multivorum]|uniref:grasp-with-spasm system ATP-grasp peptide maturase n=1 Tax=Sphingobacterium multivorum TaxID=28454 RepID=UPI0028B0F217|nr:grasp-with-spasm system ATP-grasp peptide maturase [Sphingobacterium multivorum]